MTPETAQPVESQPAQPVAGRKRKNPYGHGRVYLRGQTWHIDYWRDGECFRESSGSRKEKDAIKLLRQRRDEMARDEFIAPQNDRILVSTVLDAVTLDYANRGNRSADTLAFRLAPLKEAFGHLRAVSLTEPLIERYRAQRLAAGKARATVNRELAALRRAYRLAVEQKQIAATRVPRITTPAEDNARQGFVDIEDFQALATQLPSPLDDVARFAYHSGWRRQEILGLTWGEVDRPRGLVTLPSGRSKNKAPRTLPLTGTLAEVIERRWQARHVKGPNGSRVTNLVFHRSGAPIVDFRDPWAAACKAIGKPGLIFHDFRRSAVRNMINAGVDQVTAMKITGHRTVSVFQRYRIVSDDDVRAALMRTEASLAVNPAKQAIFPNRDNFAKHRHNAIAANRAAEG